MQYDDVRIFHSHGQSFPCCTDVSHCFTSDNLCGRDFKFERRIIWKQHLLVHGFNGWFIHRNKCQRCKLRSQSCFDDDILC